MQVRHKETKDRLEVSIDSARFFLYDRSTEEIGGAIFQAYQAGARHMLDYVGFKEEVAEDLFDEYFGRVDFDFSLPADIRLQELQEWINLYSDNKK